jgi:hypothetical protein
MNFAKWKSILHFVVTFSNSYSCGTLSFFYIKMENEKISDALSYTSKSLISSLDDRSNVKENTNLYLNRKTRNEGNTN